MCRLRFDCTGMVGRSGGCSDGPLWGVFFGEPGGHWVVGKCGELARTFCKKLRLSSGDSSDGYSHSLKDS